MHAMENNLPPMHEELGEMGKIREIRNLPKILPIFAEIFVPGWLSNAGTAHCLPLKNIQSFHPSPVIVLSLLLGCTPCHRLKV
mmetsp:Transcript_33346/g.66364  ORF Transcript_33346/g.66364 Transcript_33346/m.66364 type:complete len:83 (+) Transcript_33346:125-373(+)